MVPEQKVIKIKRFRCPQSHSHAESNQAQLKDATKEGEARSALNTAMSSDTAYTLPVPMQYDNDIENDARFIQGFTYISTDNSST
jgi:hypothetical protein